MPTFFRIFFGLGILICSASAHCAEFSTTKKDRDDRVWITISGEIVKDDEVKFRRIAFEIDKAVVQLSGPGGLLQPALEIAKAIHFKGLGFTHEAQRGLVLE